MFGKGVYFADVRLCVSIQVAPLTNSVSAPDDVQVRELLLRASQRQHRYPSSVRGCRQTVLRARQCRVQCRPELQVCWCSVRSGLVFKASIVLIRCYCRATKGLGRTQPKEWQDAGEALENPKLKGVQMPKGPAANVHDAGLHLQYNEVRLACLLLSMATDYS